MFIVKTVFEGAKGRELRRFQLDDGPDKYTALVKAVEERYGADTYVLKFADEDNDLCTIDSNESLDEAFSACASMSSAALKVFVIPMEQSESIDDIKVDVTSPSPSLGDVASEDGWECVELEEPGAPAPVKTASAPVPAPVLLVSLNKVVPRLSTVECGGTVQILFSVQNVGEGVWPSGITLDSKQDSYQFKLNAPVRRTAPGVTQVLAVDVTAPGSPGEVAVELQLMTPDGSPFGPLLTSQITIELPKEPVSVKDTADSASTGKYDYIAEQKALRARTEADKEKERQARRVVKEGGFNYLEEQKRMARMRKGLPVDEPSSATPDMPEVDDEGGVTLEEKEEEEDKVGSVMRALLNELKAMSLASDNEELDIFLLNDNQLCLETVVALKLNQQRQR